MDWSNPKSIETRIKRLTKEIADIEKFRYSFGQEDRLVTATTLEEKRDDLVRGAVLHIHTAIEDLLTLLILYAALDITAKKLKGRLRNNRAKAFRRMLYGGGSLGFDMKLNFAVGLGLIPESLRKKLIELNALRNKCSHNWQLKTVIRRGKNPKQKKPPLLSFGGRDLHKADVLADFVNEYSSVHLRLYTKWVA